MSSAHALRGTVQFIRLTVFFKPAIGRLFFISLLHKADSLWHNQNKFHDFIFGIYFMNLGAVSISIYSFILMCYCVEKNVTRAGDN